MDKTRKNIAIDKEEERRIDLIMERLNMHFNDSPMEFLTDREPWKLLFATILSAQCTDARVNQVTKVLYQHYPRLEDIAAANQEEIEREIYTTGFYHNKAKNLRACAQTLILNFGGVVPDEMEALLTLPGVGRKTANLILGEIYGKPSIVVDTHVKRVSRRLGLTTSTDPVRVEAELKTVLPKPYWMLWNTRLMALGRTYCMAKIPNCTACYLADICPQVDI